jgi:hypothetical protein
MSKERQKIVKDLDKAYSEYIRERDKYKCFTCGKQGYEKDGVMTCGHLFSRVNFSTRWTEEVAFCQCKGCNFSHEFHPEVYTKKFIDTFGQEVYDKYYIKHKGAVKFGNGDLKTLINIFKQKKAELKNHDL